MMKRRHLGLWLVVAGVVVLAFWGKSRGAVRPEFEELDPSNFAHPTTIDNQWWSLKPGTRWIYEGFSVEDGERKRHMVVDTVTDLTKEIDGVRTLVSLEEDYSDGKMVERELAFHAQDNDGNVWHLGQLRETYDGDEFVGGRAWLVGSLAGAKAGIRMQATPHVGDTYSQGYAPAPFNWTDRSRVAEMGEKMMVIDEWDAETPAGVFQTKFYTPGVGVVKIGYKGDDPEKEEMELVKKEQLSGNALTEARQEALAIEGRAYIYGHTAPAQPMSN